MIFSKNDLADIPEDERRIYL